MKNTLGIIIGFDGNNDLRELSEHRPVASVPFGGRYRVIDFMMSNLVNSGCYQVAVLMRDKYQSLLDHLGSGKDWDLSRKRGGMFLLPPNAFAPKSSPLVTENYRTSLEALGSISDMLNKNKSEHVLICSADIVANIPLDEVMKEHKKSEADVTIVCTKNPEGGAFDMFLDLSPRHEVEDIRNGDNMGGKCKYKSMGIYIMKRKYLQSLLSDCVTHNLRSFERDAMQHVFKRGDKVHGYVFDKYSAKIENVKGYFSASMDMLDKDIRDQVFLKNRPILTKIYDEAPTYYGEDAEVSDSLIADGSRIEGTVENSIIFRGCTIAKDAIVKDSIVLPNSSIGEGVELSYVVTDKGVTVRENRKMMGSATYPVAIAKNATV
ncbi:glucose-1-phosphate adenylyltransferase subunit GlgD [Butyricicoccus intestinisimiae]|uniref:Glucose-1-phosphate adenylyltransferase subunit GlgD n=1 Tax=Butyricicoccus intestinisimiae TaxID=2841509 RepID=A0ABS6ERY2_9FIRM|nr:glucose-1-phosphate adenylyltransferase subunit GlgD [Butyricicoccus intestinisimiae]MBU5490454.1 glucose-1-phosphate adenylyltransferase subunit GlgD [Butyricicoccus intestinisimiae]